MFITPYDMLKAKQKKALDNSMHLAQLTNILITMFEYKNLPETLPSWLIETILMTQGTCGVCKINGELYTGTGSYCGDVKNFVPTRYQITNVGVGSKEGEIGKDFAVGLNNSVFAPDWYVSQTASILTEIDVSERCNVLFSRLLRIPRVNDSKEKKAVESCVKAILEGRFEAVVSDNVLDDILNQKGDKFLDLVDIKEIDKLQYLNQYRDNIIKRFFQVYGQGLQSTAKLAQQTNDELHGNDTVSMILAVDRLNCRKKFVEDINSIFGTDISVDFSECWKDQREEMQEMYKGGEEDTTPTEESEGEDNERETSEQEV